MDQQHTLPRHMHRHLAACSPPQDSSTAHNTPIPSHLDKLPSNSSQYYYLKQTSSKSPDHQLFNCARFQILTLKSIENSANRRKHKHNYATTRNSNSKHKFTSTSSTSEHALHHPSLPACFEVL